MLSKVLFFVFAVIVVVPVIYLLFTKDIIRAAFAVALSLLGIAALYVLLNAEFIAVVQILIYTGGILVILIFGIMLTKRIDEKGVYTGHRGVLPGLIAFFGIGSLMGILISKASGDFENNVVQIENQVHDIGVLYMTDHLLAFELIAFILLVALVGAAYLAKKSNNV